MSIGFSYVTRRPIKAMAYTDEEFKHLKLKIEKLGLNEIIKVGRGDAQTIDDSIKENTVEPGFAYY